MLYLRQISCIILWGFVHIGLCSELEIAQTKSIINSLTQPIRVLIDKTNQDITLTSEHDSIYYKTKFSGPWNKTNNKTVLRFIKSKNAPFTRLMLNSTPLPLSPVYFRGGKYSSDAIRFGSRTYRGLLKLVPNRSTWLVINILSLKSYLAGTLASEMNASWNVESLKAQAVASRTYALSMIRNPKNRFFDLERSTSDQVYSGALSETPKIKAILEATTGQFLGINLVPKKVFFHSRCGGNTNTEKEVWEASTSNHHNVACLYCQNKPFRWTALFSTQHFLKTLNFSDPFYDLQLKVHEMDSHGRILSIKIITGKEEKLLNADRFRGLLGYRRIKSTLFNWKISKEQVLFTGTGLGHGVGMCQWGANFLARQGKTYVQILKHFYPKLTLYGPAATLPTKMILFGKKAHQKKSPSL